MKLPLEHSYEAERDHLKYPSFWKSDAHNCVAHFHSAIELVMVHRGGMEATLNGDQMRVGPGEMLVVPSYTVHSYSTPQRAESSLLLLPLDYISSFHKITKTKRFVKTVLPAEKTRGLETLFEVLMQEEVPVEKDSYTVRGVVYIVLGKLLEVVEMETIPKDSNHPDICKMLAYLDKNYQRPLSLHQLATEFGYSPNRLSHIFNKNVGYGIPEYVNMRRCRQAARLMIDKNQTVTEAAMQSGFESMRTFYRSFNQCYGIAPSDYVKKAGNLLV